MKKERKLLILLFIGILLSISIYQHRKSMHRVERIWELFQWNSGTIQVILYDTRTEQELDRIANTCYKKIPQLDTIINEHNKNSQAGKLKQNLQQLGKHSLSSELKYLLEFAYKMSQDTEGIFDITIAPLIQLWKQAALNNTLPTETQIEQCKTRIGYTNFTIHNDCIENKIPLDINLGAYTKGYAVDKIVEFLQSQNIPTAMVNLGGDLACYGEKIWTIGIQNPDVTATKPILATIQIKNKAVATSGHYHRYAMIQGKPYSHIIHPHTGKPIENETLSATVIANSGIIADAYATVYTILEPNQAIQHAQQRNLQLLLLLKGNKILMTPNFPLHSLSE
ncbi:MAG TPA: FAD:protein FMN transferase [Planctomycetota bacterium]|nr:FAD:protein FMN transferase [Planctomycetota bacterium]HRU51750.1 FAD:protein FMN transferase [Planctomycetota bacterium]